MGKITALNQTEQDYKRSPKIKFSIDCIVTGNNVTCSRILLKCFVAYERGNMSMLKVFYFARKSVNLKINLFEKKYQADIEQHFPFNTRKKSVHKTLM